MARIVDEIRRGNWLDLYGTHLQATGISDAYIVFEEPNYDVVNPDDIKGIELTPEWLERFGFYKYSHDWILQQGDANQIPLIRIFNPSEKLFLEDKSGTIIRTVHHLQNFFHALYSRELELKK